MEGRFIRMNNLFLLILLLSSIVNAEMLVDYGDSWFLNTAENRVESATSNIWTTIDTGHGMPQILHIENKTGVNNKLGYLRVSVEGYGTDGDFKIYPAYDENRYHTLNESKGTNRMVLYLKVPEGEFTFHVGTYSKDPNSYTTQLGTHYYHYLTIIGNNNTYWTKIIINKHPQHLVGEKYDPGDNPTSSNGWDYYDGLSRFYIEMKYSPWSSDSSLFSPYNVSVDEIEFYTETRPENTYSINSIALTYFGNGSFTITWRSFSQYEVHYETYEIRYSTNPILDEDDYNNAQLVPNIPQGGWGQENVGHHDNDYRADFTIPNIEKGKTYYFAIKDLYSEIPNKTAYISYFVPPENNESQYSENNTSQINKKLEYSRINPDNEMNYIGSFRLPNEISNGHSWDYGGYGLAYEPNFENTHGLKGSLYSAGFSAGAGNIVKNVSEFSIPTPVISNNINDLNYATTLQHFGDITEGFYDLALQGLELRKIRGLSYLGEEYNLTPKIYWSVFSDYNVADNNNPSIGYSNPNISNPEAQGCWNMKNYDGRHVLGHKLFNIPKEWADVYTNSSYLATGVVSNAEYSSRGPSLFAIAPYKYNNSNQPQNNSLDIIPLLFYTDEHTYPGYIQADKWISGAWITIENKSSLVLFGLKCVGEYCYGTAEHCNNDTCNIYKGYHCYPRVPIMVFYDVNEISEIARGIREPWNISPYKIINLSQIIPFYTECSETTGAAYDQENYRLYILQHRGDGTKPLIHVFEFKPSNNCFKFDSDCDGKISINELNKLINQWLHNNLSIHDIFETLKIWKNK